VRRGAVAADTAIASRFVGALLFVQSGGALVPLTWRQFVCNRSPNAPCRVLARQPLYATCLLQQAAGRLDDVHGSPQ
jgi:hypothetical protein